jgi:hypothetical protein
MAVDDDLAKVVQVTEELTNVVENEVDRIQAENTASQQKHDAFIASSDARYLGTLAGGANFTINATAGMVVNVEVVNAYQAGHKLVRVHVPAGTTCYWDDQVLIPPGSGLHLTGHDDNSSIIKVRRWAPYQVYEVTRHMITAITMYPGSVVRTHKINLRHEVQDDTKAAPYEHGFIRLAWGNYSAGHFHVSLSNSRFDTYDCVVYVEGMCPTMGYLTFDSCHLVKVANPGWFDNPNCGWVGVGSWGHPGLPVMVNKQLCTRTADTATDKVFDFVDCWSTGTDRTSAILARAYSGSYFVGMIN